MQGSIPEYDLFHIMVGADIKHVDAAFAVEQDIQAGCRGGQDEEQGCRSDKIPYPQTGFPGQEQIQGKKNHQKVPQIAVKSQKGELILHTALVGKDGDPSQKTKVHEEGGKHAGDVAGTGAGSAFAIGQSKQTPNGKQIEGHAAELERKIPPLIGMIVGYI